MRILLLLYVDDMSIAYAGTAATIAKEIKRRLAEKYKVTNLGTAKQFLGIEISTETSGKQAHKEISLGQKAYITSVLKRFSMENALEQPRQWLLMSSLMKQRNMERGKYTLQNIRP